MSATRTRSKSSKKSTQKRGRSTSLAARGAKGGGTAARKSTRASGGARGAAKKSASRTSGASRTKGTPIAQSIELLKEDHKEVQKLFRQAERLKDDVQRLRPIVEQACAALKQHTRIEEQYFYPVMQQASKETDLIAEAYVEHASAKQLIQQLERGNTDGEKYAATFTVLGEYVKHHIKEEEEEIFPKARRAAGDFEPLLDALMAKKEGAEAEPMAGSEMDEAREPGRRAARGRQGRGRAARESAQADGGGAAREAMESDIEQPRRGRRGAEQEETGETETAGRGREQESVEQEDRTRSNDR
jgi:hemerythrin superfamily protein